MLQQPVLQPKDKLAVLKGELQTTGFGNCTFDLNQC